MRVPDAAMSVSCLIRRLPLKCGSRGSDAERHRVGIAPRRGGGARVNGEGSSRAVNRSRRAHRPRTSSALLYSGPRRSTGAWVGLNGTLVFLLAGLAG